MNERKFSGIIKKVSPVKALGEKFWSWGIQLEDGSWHNCGSPSKEDLEYLEIFLEGDAVAGVERQNNKGYWNISTMEKIDKASLPKPEPKADFMASIGDDMAKAKGMIDHLFASDEKYKDFMGSLVSTAFIEMRKIRKGEK